MTAGRDERPLPLAAAGGRVGGRRGDALRVVGGRAVVVFDRIDAVVVPPTGRALARVGERLGDSADEIVSRLRERAGALLAPPTRAAGEQLAATGLRAALRPDGLVVRGARFGVVAAVGLIVVSALAATLQNPSTDQFTAGAPSGTAVSDGGRGGGGPGGVAVPEPASVPDGTAVPGAAVPGAVVPGAAVPGGASAPPPSTTVGPYPSDPADLYVADARRRLANLAAAPEAELHAVVSLRGYSSPDELRALVAGFRLVRVFLRTPPDGVVVSGPVLDPVADVDAAYATAFEQATRLVGTTGDDAVRDRAARDAEQFETRCSCLFAVVVRAPAARLAELAELAAVRVVDPAPPGSSPATTVFVPLVPERR